MPSIQSRPQKIEHLAETIRRFYSCEPAWIATVPVRKAWHRGFATEGIVQVFELSGHNRAKRCYVYNYKESGEWFYTTVLEVPPVVDAESAVKAGMARRKRTVTKPSPTPPP